MIVNYGARTVELNGASMVVSENCFVTHASGRCSACPFVKFGPTKLQVCELASCIWESEGEATGCTAVPLDDRES